jgi:hypothetical protein
MVGRLEEPTDPSLVPLVRAEESRLASALEETKAQAKTSIAEAQDQAEQRIEAARQRIPQVIEKTRVQEIQNLEAFTKTHEERGRVKVKDMERRANANLPAAVERILSLVLPEDRA